MSVDAQPGTDREQLRQELAELVEVDIGRVTDGARLAGDLQLDSLAMMCVLTWLESRGVTIGSERAVPPTVGGVLALAERAGAVPGVSIVINADGRAGNGQRLGPATLTSTRPVSPLVPVMRTATLKLDLIQERDVGFLYALAAQPETGFRWRYRGAPPPFERFAAELWSQVLVQFVVRSVDGDQPLGHVVAYSASPSRRHAYVGAVFDSRSAGTGLPAQAVLLFTRYLFHTFGMAKLYLEVPGFNWPQLQSGEGRLFRVEGVLRDHDYYAGRTWDSYLLAIYPDASAADTADA